MNLYLVRHGQTQENLQGVVQGQTDGALSALGQAQARLLAERFRDVPLDAVITSDLGRAFETAAAIAAAHELVPQPEPLLRERDYGVFTGRSVAELKIGVWSVKHRDMVPGGESLADMDARAGALWRQWRDRLEGMSVVAVTHGAFLQFLLPVLLDTPRPDTWGAILANACVSLLTCTNGSACRAEFLNDTSHLNE